MGLCAQRPLFGIRSVLHLILFSSSPVQQTIPLISRESLRVHYSPLPFSTTMRFVFFNVSYWFAIAAASGCQLTLNLL